MGIGSKLLDPTYSPVEVFTPSNFYFKKIIKCPVKFTTDPLEYSESFLEYKLRPLQKEVLIDLFSKDVSGKDIYDVAVLILGMRAGKSALSGILGSFLLQKLLAMDSPSKELGQLPGYPLTGEYIATSEQQSKQTAYSSFESIVLNTLWWSKYIAYLKEREATEGRETLFQRLQRSVSFPEKNLHVLSLHSNSASLAGLTAFFVGFDELSRFNVSDGSIQEKSEARSAQAVYFTASRAAKSLSPFSKIIVTTSPMYEDDFGMQLLGMAKTLKAGKHVDAMNRIRAKYPEKVENSIAYNYTTYEVNPKSDENPSGYNEDSFKSERISNPTAYYRDYEALPAAAISPFIEHPEMIDKCVVKQKDPVALFEDIITEETISNQYMHETRRYVAKKITPLRGDKFKKYFICSDAGETKDSFVVAMGHGEEVDYVGLNSKGEKVEAKRYKAVIDLLEVWKPVKEEKLTVSFQNVEEVILTLGEYFHVSKAIYDQWQSVESIQRIFSKGIYTDRLGATLEMYDVLKLLIYQGLIDIPDNQLLNHELRTLECIKNKKVDHPPGMSKDLSDAVCRVAWCIYEDCIRDSIQGNFLMPLSQSLPTIRSVATAYEYFRNSQMNDIYYNNSSFGVFGDGASGNVFGKETVVRGNVMPNFNK